MSDRLRIIVQDGPLWPWALAGLLIGALSALALIAAIVPHNEPTGTPTLANPK